MQRCLDAGHRIAVGEEHAGAHEGHHLFVRQRVLMAEEGEPVEVEVSESGRANRPKIRAAAFHDERAGLASEEIGLRQLDRGVAAARLDERRVAADEIREIDELLDVCLAGVGVVPGVHQRLRAQTRHPRLVTVTGVSTRLASSGSAMRERRYSRTASRSGSVNIGRSHDCTCTSLNTSLTIEGASSLSNVVGACVGWTSGESSRRLVLATNSPPTRKTRCASRIAIRGSLRWYSIHSAATAPADPLRTGNCVASASPAGCVERETCPGERSIPKHGMLGPSKSPRRPWPEPMSMTGDKRSCLMRSATISWTSPAPWAADGRFVQRSGFVS